MQTPYTKETKETKSFVLHPGANAPSKERLDLVKTCVNSPIQNYESMYVPVRSAVPHGFRPALQNAAGLTQGTLAAFGPGESVRHVIRLSVCPRSKSSDHELACPL